MVEGARPGRRDLGPEPSAEGSVPEGDAAVLPDQRAGLPEAIESRLEEGSRPPQEGLEQVRRRRPAREGQDLEQLPLLGGQRVEIAPVERGKAARARSEESRVGKEGGCEGAR